MDITNFKKIGDHRKSFFLSFWIIYLVPVSFIRWIHIACICLLDAFADAEEESGDNTKIHISVQQVAIFYCFSFLKQSKLIFYTNFSLYLSLI